MTKHAFNRIFTFGLSLATALGLSCPKGCGQPDTYSYATMHFGDQTNWHVLPTHGTNLAAGTYRTASINWVQTGPISFTGEAHLYFYGNETINNSITVPAGTNLYVECQGNVHLTSGCNISLVGVTGATGPAGGSGGTDGCASFGETGGPGGTGGTGATGGTGPFCDIRTMGNLTVDAGATITSAGGPGGPGGPGGQGENVEPGYTIFEGTNGSQTVVYAQNGCGQFDSVWMGENSSYGGFPVEGPTGGGVDIGNEEEPGTGGNGGHGGVGGVGGKGGTIILQCLGTYTNNSTNLTCPGGAAGAAGAGGPAGQWIYNGAGLPNGGGGPGSPGSVGTVGSAGASGTQYLHQFFSGPRI